MVIVPKPLLELYTPNQLSLANTVSATLYLPGNGAAAPISPSFDPSWTNTASATRRLGRLNARFNSANEDVSVAGSVGQVVLVRQYVIPLQGSGIVVRKNTWYTLGSSILSAAGPIVLSAPNGTGSGSTIDAFAHRSAGTGTIVLRGCYRVVTATGGAPASANRTISVTIAANNSTITSAGLFLPSDAFSQFNVVGVANPFTPNTIISVPNASTAIMLRQYGVGAVPGVRNITLRQFTDYVGGASAGGVGSTLTNTLVGCTFSAGNASGFSVTTQALEDYYLVVELGFNVTAGTTSTCMIRFGDPSSTLVAPGDASSLSRSSGAFCSYLRPQPFIL